MKENNITGLTKTILYLLKQDRYTESYDAEQSDMFQDAPGMAPVEQQPPEQQVQDQDTFQQPVDTMGVDQAVQADPMMDQQPTQEIPDGFDQPQEGIEEQVLACPTCGGVLTSSEQGNWCETCQSDQQQL